MNNIELLDYLTKKAIKYRLGASESINRNKHMNMVDSSRYVDQEIIDAVLVDFINDIGLNNGVDYALYTRDLDVKSG